MSREAVNLFPIRHLSRSPVLFECTESNNMVLPCSRSEEQGRFQKSSGTPKVWHPIPDTKQRPTSNSHPALPKLILIFLPDRGGGGGRVDAAAATAAAAAAGGADQWVLWAVVAAVGCEQPARTSPSSSFTTTTTTTTTNLLPLLRRRRLGGGGGVPITVASPHFIMACSARRGRPEARRSFSPFRFPAMVDT